MLKPLAARLHWEQLQTCYDVWEQRWDNTHHRCIPLAVTQNSWDLFLEAGTISLCKSTSTFFHLFCIFALKYYITYITLHICFSPYTTSVTDLPPPNTVTKVSRPTSSRFTFLPFFFCYYPTTIWKPDWVTGDRDCCHFSVLKGTDFLMEIESESLDSMGKFQIDKFSEWISPNLAAYNICIYWA